MVDVGPDVVVDSDGHVLVLDQVDDARVRVGGLVHDVAPVAPHRGDGQQDGPVGPPSLCKCRLRPRAPADLGGAIGARREMELGGVWSAVGVGHKPSVRMAVWYSPAPAAPLTRSTT